MIKPWALEPALYAKTKNKMKNKYSIGELKNKNKEELIEIIKDLHKLNRTLLYLKGDIPSALTFARSEECWKKGDNPYG